jgi:general secretion pathway protein D
MEMEGAAAPATDAWSAPPRTRLDSNASYVYRNAGAPLLASKTVAEPSVSEGTGQFLGTSPVSATRARPDESGGGVTLNLVGVPIPQAAKTVLGDFLATEYTLDPTLEGKVTLQTPGPVSKSTALDLFQSALRSNKAAMIYAGGAYKIVPLDQATAGARLRVEGEPDSGGRFGSEVRVVQLKYVNASEIRRILDPISPRGAIVKTDDSRNTITLSGNDQDINGMLEAISIFDVDVMKGMSFAIVPVRTSQPSAIADEMKSIFASDKEGPMAGMMQFLPNKRLGAILVITPQQRYLSRAVTWIRKLDSQAEGTEKEFYTYSVQNRQASELVSVLQSMFSNGKGASTSEANRNVAPQYQDANLQSSGFQKSSMQSGGGMAGSAFSSKPSSGESRSQPSTNSAGDAGASVQLGRDDATGEARIKVVADENKNAILIEANPADYRRVLRVIGTLDVLPNQVLIEATIAEITLKDDLQFGLRWYLANKNSSATFTDDVTGAVGSVFPGFSYALKAANVSATLSALNQITDVNVISSPSLSVADNRTATLQVGDQVPITTQSAVSVLTPGSPVVNSVSYKDTGVILSITPRINESGRVMLEIEQEVSTVSETTSSSINSPTISQRRVRTSVVVNDGEVFALGGMMQQSKTVTRTQIPIVGDIPIIGNAFKTKDNQIGKTELIILIAPHVIRNLNEARQVTDEFRRELAINIPYGRRQPRTLDQTIRRTFE